MPLYEMRCAAGHSADLLRSLAERDAPATCACGLPLTRAVSQTAPIVVAGRVGPREGAWAEPAPADVVYDSPSLRVAVHGGGHDIRCAELKCGACGHDYFDALAVDDAVPPCPKCGSPGTEKPRMAYAEHNKRYPYFDRGLGLWITSPGHRAQVCKERGLTPVDGDWDVDRALADEERQNAADDAEYEAYQDKLNHHPAYAGYRRARDNGWLND